MPVPSPGQGTTWPPPGPVLTPCNEEAPTVNELARTLRPAPTQDDDSLLLALVEALDAALKRFADVPEPVVGFGPPDTYLAASEAVEAIAGAIAALPATTWAGAKAKALAYAACCGEPNGADMEALDPVQAQLVASILRDVAGLG
jgi:hypothetical protein